MFKYIGFHLPKSPNKGSSACCQNIHLWRERKWHFRFACCFLADWLLITSFPTCPSMGIFFLRWLFWEWLLGRLWEKLAGNYRREGNGLLPWQTFPPGSSTGVGQKSYKDGYDWMWKSCACGCHLNSWIRKVRKTSYRLMKVILWTTPMYFYMYWCIIIYYVIFIHDRAGLMNNKPC